MTDIDRDTLKRILELQKGSKIEPKARLEEGEMVYDMPEDYEGALTPEVKRQALMNMRDSNTDNLKEELEKIQNMIETAEDPMEKQMLEDLLKKRLENYNIEDQQIENTEPEY